MDPDNYENLIVQLSEKDAEIHNLKTQVKNHEILIQCLKHENEVLQKEKLEKENKERKKGLLNSVTGRLEYVKKAATLYFVPEANSKGDFGEQNPRQLSIHDSLNLGAPAGITNVASTCYMSAMIQALASSDLLIKQLKDLPTKSTILRQFIDLLSLINEPRLKREFRALVEKFMNTLQRNEKGQRDAFMGASAKLGEFTSTVDWNRNGQQDAFQLLSFFINAIHCDIRDEIDEMPPKIKILHIFTENSSFNKIQDHLALSLSLGGSYNNPPGVDIKDLVSMFFVPTIIEDSFDCTAMCFYGKAPEVMILHIQANEWNSNANCYQKVRYFIMYGSEFSDDLVVHRNENGNDPHLIHVTYRLVSVVEHLGSVDSGHYITYRQNNNSWYKANDKEVRPIDFQYNVVPYIMVYEKINEEYIP